MLSEARVEDTAQRIYEGLCAEGLEECFAGTPWAELPVTTQDAYRRIARGLDSEP